MPAIIIRSLAIIAMFAGVSGVARASVISSEVLLDSMQGDTYTDQTTPAFYIHNFSIDDLRHAVRFTVPATSTYQFDVVELLLAARFNSSQKVTVSLHANQASLPGAVLGSVTLTNLPVRPDGAGAMTFTPQSVSFPGAPDLDPGANYWIALSSPELGNFTDVYWYTNRTNLTGPSASYSSLNWTAWQFHTDVTLPRLTVKATPIPEPAAATLLLGALAARRRPRR